MSANRSIWRLNSPLLPLPPLQVVATAAATVVDRRPEILIGDLVGTTTAPGLAASPVMLPRVNIKVRAAARMRRRVTTITRLLFQRKA